MHCWVEEPSVDDGKTIVIYECSDREGSTFALSSATTRKLVESFGDKLHVVPRVFVAHGPNKHDRLHGNLAKPLIALLTGLEDELLVKIETVVFWDPVTDQRL
jgi:hypothetical protein